jgi:hypothetical protein
VDTDMNPTFVGGTTERGSKPDSVKLTILGVLVRYLLRMSLIRRLL